MTVVANHQSSCNVIQESLINLVHLAQQIQYHLMDSHIDQFPYDHCIAVQKFYKIDEQLHQFCLHIHIVIVFLEDIDQGMDLYLLHDTLSQNHIINQHVVEESNCVYDNLFVMFLGNEVGVDDKQHVGRQQRVIVGRFIEESSDVDQQLKCIDVDVRIFFHNRMLDALVDQLVDDLSVFVEDTSNEADSHDLQVIFFLRTHIFKLVYFKTIGKDAVGNEYQLLVLNNGLLTCPYSDHDVSKCIFFHWVYVQNKQACVIKVFYAISHNIVVENSITFVFGGKNLPAFQDIQQCMLDNSLDFLFGKGAFNYLIDDIDVMRPLHSANPFHLQRYFLNLLRHNRSNYPL